MGLLDDMGPLLRGKPKTMPGLPGDNLDFGMGLPPIGNPPPIPTGGPNALLKQEMTPGPNRITPTMASTEAPRGMDYGLGDTGFGGDVRQALAKPPGGGISEPQRRGLVAAATDMDFGLGDKGFGKNPARLAEGLPMTASDPSPTAGLLAANVPLPPSRPAGLGGMPPTRSAAAVPLPPPRPAGLGGTEVASLAAPPHAAPSSTHSAGSTADRTHITCPPGPGWRGGRRYGWARRACRAALEDRRRDSGQARSAAA